MSANRKTRGELFLLVGLLAVLAALAYFRFGRRDATATAASPAGTAAQPSNQAAAGSGRAGLPVTDVRLEALKHDGGRLEDAERNPFRFQAKAPPPSPPRLAPPPQALAPPVTGPPPPPPPPAIPLKYVGLLGAVAQRDRVAVLSDSRGNPFYGREGDIIEGRYRVLRIAADSVDLAYADGRGRQTLRLSAQ
jgi:hypothetical protein